MITHSDPDYINKPSGIDDSLSFRGVGVFVYGKLHNGPFTYVVKDLGGKSFTKMQNGRPAEGSILTEFYREGRKIPVYSLEEGTDVSGW
jgi:hypothetical protein